MTTPIDLLESNEEPEGSSENCEQLLKPGDRLEHCRITELIAVGGMANVYKVWHEQLEVVRAVKILKPGFSEETKNRLETEAKISANLHHVNIVEIYGLRYWHDIPYIEMEYVDGSSLKDFLDSNVRLPIDLAIAITHYICKALQFAHNQDMTLYGKTYDGLVHRDIKPANILISSKGVVKLADFGIARPSEVSMHTVGTKVMGTFAYLSPEQFNSEPLDLRSDIYSLGTVLYEMVTGYKAFPQKLLAELVQKKAKGYYLPLNMTGLKFPRGFCNAVERCLHLEQNKRYPDASYFDTDLMSIFKRLTSKDTEMVIQEYLEKPNALNPITFKNFNFRAALTSCAKLIGITLLIWVIGVWALKSAKEYYFNKMALKSTQSVSQTPIDTLKNKPTDTVKVVPQPKLPSLTPYEKATKAFDNSDYKTAALLFEKLSTKSLTEKQKNLRVIKMMQSYINLDNFKKVISISESETCSDARFYLLTGQAYHATGKFDDALAVLKQAYSAKFRSTGNLSKVAILEAKVSESIYTAKPNSINKKVCYDFWNAYLQNYCSDKQSSGCREARNKISLYE